MASGYDNFWSIGPSHLTSVDWDNAHHRRSVAASLVKGVYVLENDRERGKIRQDSQALAPPWWEFLHFDLVHPLVDDVDDIIFGAIFQYKPQAYTNHRAIHRSPWFVIAFRGTGKTPDTFSRDIELDADIIRNCLHKTSRFTEAMNVVQDMVASNGVSKLWLTGHSLGAALGLLVGKTMARAGSFLESFLFNPPYVSPLPVERIVKKKKIRHGVRLVGTFIKAFVLAAAADDNENNNQRYKQDSYEAAVEKRDSFAAISGWIPSLFVNQKDPVCSEYIGYFEHRKKLEDIGAGDLARVSTQHSLGGIVASAVGLHVDHTSEPVHVLPSAHLTENLIPSRSIKEAHGLPQWWNADCYLKWTVYKYTSS